MLRADAVFLHLPAATNEEPGLVAGFFAWAGFFAGIRACLSAVATGLRPTRPTVDVRRRCA